MKTGDVFDVRFALGYARVKLLEFNYQYCDGAVWHVEDVITGHQDMVGIEHLEPIIKINNRTEVRKIRVKYHELLDKRRT